MINYQFKDVRLLQNALTHSSYANENRDKGVRNNERLEFLGDSVLGFLCAEYIYSEYSALPEGELTKLRAAVVCEGSLFEFAESIGLGEMLLLGRGEKQGGGSRRPSVLSDAVEAVLAAIYLDGGMDAARDFIMDFIKRKSAQVVRGQRTMDYKTALQEIVQKNHQETLSYQLVGESGPDHDKRFRVAVFINNNPIAHGEGHSKKTAEQAAAKAALALMGHRE